MTLRSRRFSHTHRIKASQWAIALALGASMGSLAHAATVGHSRVVSAPGAPLQVVVPLENITADELTSLRVAVADAAAWRRAGLEPPVSLDSLRVSVQDSQQTTTKNIRIVSTQPLATPAVDLLLDLQSSTGHRQVQVTILVPQRATAAPVQSARVGTANARNAASAAGTDRVRAGDTLFRIAGRNRVPDATVYQMLVALWRANPRAFIQNNMNLVRAGETLTIPDAATVNAIDPSEARRIYVEQAEAFARYRGRAAASVSDASAAGDGANTGGGRVSTASSAGGRAETVAQDRLRLSAAGSADAGADTQADTRTSEQHALQDAQQRVDTLQGNVDALSQAAANAGLAAGQASAGANQPGSAGANGAAGPAASGGNAAGATGGADTGVAGAAGATGAAGSAANTGTATGTDSTAAGAGTAGGADTAAPSATAGASGAAGANAIGAPNVSGSEAAAQDLAAASGNATTNVPATSGNWFADNLLVIVTGILALIVLIVAWLLRRAGARRADDNEDDSSSYGEPAFDAALLNSKLDGINLDLDSPPTDEPPKRGPRV